MSTKPAGGRQAATTSFAARIRDVIKRLIGLGELSDAVRNLTQKTDSLDSTVDMMQRRLDRPSGVDPGLDPRLEALIERIATIERRLDAQDKTKDAATTEPETGPSSRVAWFVLTALLGALALLLLKNGAAL